MRLRVAADIAATIATERRCAARLNMTAASVRNYRYRMRRAGVSVIASWRWTASEEAALIRFVRHHPVYYADFWADAGQSCGRGASACRFHWTVMARRGVPLPPIAYHRRRKRTSWPAERVAVLAQLLAEVGRARAAQSLGCTVSALGSAIRRYGLRVPGMPRVAMADYDAGDAAYAEKAWNEFEQRKGE